MKTSENALQFDLRHGNTKLGVVLYPADENTVTARIRNSQGNLAVLTIDRGTDIVSGFTASPQDTQNCLVTLDKMKRRVGLPLTVKDALYAVLRNSQGYMPGTFDLFSISLKD
jgi:hypothetical protein